MNGLFGAARTVIKHRYAVITPESCAPATLPGWRKAACQVLISPALGARFAQVLVTLQADGECVGNTGANQYFIYILEGPASILLDDRRYRLDTGNYVYLPPGKDVQLNSGSAKTRVLALHKPYHPLPGTAKPAALVHHEREVKGLPLAANEPVQSQVLLPDQPTFDMAVDLLTFPPGAALTDVTAQVMDQGVLLLRGQGLWRLNEDWHPVRTGDALWVGPHCPHWFAAIGKGPTSLLCYREANRDVL